MSSVVCSYNTFENNFKINHLLKYYMNEICELLSDQLFSFKYFLKIAFFSVMYLATQIVQEAHIKR